jgi:two-component system, LuxR family, response regulator FixJ
MTSEPVIYVVDDNDQMCASLQWLLEGVGYEVRTFGSASAFLNAGPPARPACMLLDVRMRETDGLTLLDELQRRNLRLPVIMMTGHADVATAVRALTHGATDFLEKPLDHATLLGSVESALKLEKERVKSERQAEQARKRLSVLTDRERQVLLKVLQGLSSKQIAAELQISQRTVENHRGAIMRKTGAISVAELVHASILAGLWPEKKP